MASYAQFGYSYPSASQVCQRQFFISSIAPRRGERKINYSMLMTHTMRRLRLNSALSKSQISLISYHCTLRRMEANSKDFLRKVSTTIVCFRFQLIFLPFTPH